MSTSVELIVDESVSITRRASRDEWDRDDTYTTWYVQGAKIGDGYKSCPYPDELKVGDAVYCVYVVYSTGDSFGIDDHGRLEFISVHKNKDLAQKNANEIERKSGYNADAGPIIIEHDDGTKITMRYVPWDGYFENFEYVEVIECILK